MRAMHRVTRLKRDDAIPAVFRKPRAQGARRIAQFAEVVVFWWPYTAQATAQGHRLRPLEQFGDAGMQAIGAAENLLCLVQAVRSVDIQYLEHGQRYALAIAQGNFSTCGYRCRYCLADVKRDGHRPQSAVGETQMLDHRLVVALTEKTIQWRECATQQQFEIAQLAWIEIDAGQAGAVLLERLCVSAR